MNKKEQAKLRMRKMRNKDSVTSDSVTKDNVTQEMVPISFVQGLNGRMYEGLPERPRYLTLSDGQVLDRLNLPIGHTNKDRIARMQRCNESAYNYHPNESSKERVKLLLKGV